MSEFEALPEITEPVLRALAHEELKHRRRREDLKAAHKSARNHVKTLGIDLKDFDQVIKQLLADDGGDAFVSKLSKQHALMKLLDMPVAKRFAATNQMELPFAEAKEEARNTNGVSKHFRLGAIAHLEGKEESDLPFSANTPEGQDWLEGYRHNVALCTSGSKEMERIKKGLPKEGEAARGTLPAKAPKPAKTFGGKEVKSGNGAANDAADKPAPRPRGRPRKHPPVLDA